MHLNGKQDPTATMERRREENDVQATPSPGLSRLEVVVARQMGEHDRSFHFHNPSRWQTNFSLLEHSIRLSEKMHGIGRVRKRLWLHVVIGSLAGFFHDVGKINPSCHLYRLNRKLKGYEKLAVDKHPVISEEIILDFKEFIRQEDWPLLEAIARVARNHHKPWCILSPKWLREIAWDVRHLDILISLMENRHRPGLGQFQAIEVLPDVAQARTPLLAKLIFRKEIEESIRIIIGAFGSSYAPSA